MNIPEWLGFIKGVVDSEDLPLTSPEKLFNKTKSERLSRRTLSRRLEMFAEIQENQED